MTAQHKVLFVGCGNMGAALASGYARHHPAADIRAIDHDPERATGLLTEEAKTRISIVGTVGELGNFQPDMVVLALKPQALKTALADLIPVCAKALVVSIAAGTCLTQLQALLGDHRRIIRAMPNLPVVVGAGASALFAPASAASDLDMACALFASVGTVERVTSEEQIDAATALAGSGPAYFFAFVEQLALSGMAIGLPQDLAERLARQTCIGAAALLSQDKRSASELKAAVCSPKGTTEAGLAAMQNTLASAADEAVSAAHRRARELAAD